MRGRDYAILFACMGIAGVLLVAAGAQLDYINGQREAMNLTINTPLENAPPTLAFAVLGQARWNGLLAPEAESRLVASLLQHWALRRALAADGTCAREKGLRP